MLLVDAWGSVGGAVAASKLQENSTRGEVMVSVADQHGCCCCCLLLLLPFLMLLSLFPPYTPLIDVGLFRLRSPTANPMCRWRPR